MFIILCLSYPYAACSFFTAGVASAGAVLGVGAAAGGAAAFAVNTGENWGGPVFFDGFVFCLAFLPVAWSLRNRSWSAGDPAVFEIGGMVSNVSCLPGLP